MLTLPVRPIVHDYGNKKVFWLALTGGPCSGKTTALSRLERELSNKGYKVFIIDEAATRIIKSGVKYEEFHTYDFQTYIALSQIVFERIIEDAVQKCTYDKIVVVCDRGLIDGKAYMEPNDFSKMLNEFGTTETEVRDSYDAVIHLVTAANGAEKYYSLANNKARRESPEEARAIDEKTLNSWIGHPHVSIIDNSTSFKKKVVRTLESVYSMLGVPIPIETYKKYLVKMPDLSRLEKESNFSKVDITRIYLLNEDNENERSILQRGQFGDYAFYYTEKRHFKGFDRIDVERRLTKNEYVSLIGQADTRLKQINKTRYCFVWNNKYYELDVFGFWNDKALLKIQLTDRDSVVEIPEFLEVIKDVSNDMSYTNYSLAQNVYN